MVFLDALTRPAPDETIVIAVRADFYGRFAALPTLAALLAENHVLVGPMKAEDLRRAIELPSRKAGLSVEPALVDALVADVVDEPGGLPLLSTALVELWQHRDGRTLRLETYRRAAVSEEPLRGLPRRRTKTSRPSSSRPPAASSSGWRAWTATTPSGAERPFRSSSSRRTRMRRESWPFSPRAVS